MEVDCQSTQLKPYRSRRPAKTVLYQVVQGHLETVLAAQDDSTSASPAHAERVLGRYLECRILAHGFARALRRLRPRLPERLLLQGPRRSPVVQHASHGRDGGASRRSRPHAGGDAPMGAVAAPAHCAPGRAGATAAALPAALLRGARAECGVAPGRDGAGVRARFRCRNARPDRCARGVIYSGR